MKKQLALLGFVSLSCLSISHAQNFSVATGGAHSIFLCDSNLHSTGWNIYGQLGIGSLTNHLIPSPINGLTDVEAMAAGYQHSLFLKGDGTVWACGLNGSGGLGDGTTQDRDTPVEIVGFTDVNAIAAGASHSLFLKNDGTVWSCGSNYYGQLGDGTTTDGNIPAQIMNLSGITQFSTFSGANLFLKNDGTVMGCGSNNGALGDGTNFQRNTPVSVSGLTGVIDISMGAGYSLFLKNDGTVWASGTNSSGQLGDGTNIQRFTPVQVGGLTDVVSISAGQTHSLFLKADGTVWSCGLNSDGQLGNGDLTGANVNVPTQIEGLSDVRSIAASWWYSIVLKNDGTVWGFGRNDIGQLGGTQTGLDEYLPIQSLYECDIETGIREERTEFDLAIYPNPASQEVRVEVTGSQAQAMGISITNMLGQAVLSLPFGEVGEAINISSLANGMYTIAAALQSGETLRQRLVVQH